MNAVFFTFVHPAWISTPHRLEEQFRTLTAHLMRASKQSADAQGGKKTDKQARQAASKAQAEIDMLSGNHHALYLPALCVCMC
jgi:hypothetical protein